MLTFVYTCHVILITYVRSKSGTTVAFFPGMQNNIADTLRRTMNKSYWLSSRDFNNTTIMVAVDKRTFFRIVSNYRG